MMFNRLEDDTSETGYMGAKRTCARSNLAKVVRAWKALPRAL